MSAHDHGPGAPVGEPLLAPDVNRPYWRDKNGRRLGFSEVLQRSTPAARDGLAEAQTQSIAALQRAAFEALAAGEHAESRRLFVASSRLCTEPLGHWTSTSTDTDG